MVRQFVFRLSILEAFRIASFLLDTYKQALLRFTNNFVLSHYTASTTSPRGITLVESSGKIVFTSNTALKASSSSLSEETFTLFEFLLFALSVVAEH